MIQYEKKDACRRNFGQYTLKAFSALPQVKNPEILDAGCGTGSLSLLLIEQCDGIIYAVDSDQSCADYFAERVRGMKLTGRRVSDQFIIF